MITHEQLIYKARIRCFVRTSREVHYANGSQDHACSVSRAQCQCVSILMAFALALWELYFFWIAGQGYLPNVDRVLETYLLNRIGYTLAWICLIYLSYQLISIPFSESNTLLKVFDGMSSLLPLGVVTIALVRPAPNMGQRYDEALFLMGTSKNSHADCAVRVCCSTA